MHRFLRAPLTWMIVAECAVVGALTLIAWHTLAGATGPGSDPLLLPPTAAAPAEDALPAAGVPVVGAPSRGPLPGLNLGAGFWRLRLGRLNRDEAAFEALEWRITHAVMEAAHDYLETVVLPAVRHAEGVEGRAA
ncbi:MAG: hypothetical protein AUG06_03165 [Actinobacteria bacterium 13_1_20CM_2_65_11]|nr:MAG: hypothetical protein AUH40_09060 [Chloroflexi bacterium 13_1_40CM_65_17]OLC66415.1 MAG: hypothetical protein AUH69_07320 [Actinobacteria bacterium 13_1_40CM_4_65_12]OLD25179.1 MAG: hypothetical protein AUJ02_05965 [Chloroflexi bacterium 13_1_40CM_3_65_12]OLD49827.1 MAG: hypothetical protein AUI42_06310 [Actinobacteria bacterium 13_1_40CM_2_65_8]OLE80953.1 MAG: hypothetical protein AUG06_03165 [Actinobacteria bacterium 13_1_20CM_2_65_11]